MTREEFADKFEKLGMADFKISGPRIEVDATYPEKIDVEDLINKIRQSLENVPCLTEHFLQINNLFSFQFLKIYRILNI